MTATITVEKESLISVMETAAIMSVILEAQRTIHENHVYTDSPEISFSLVNSTLSLDKLNEKMILSLADMVGTKCTKLVFEKTLDMLYDEELESLDQLTKAILDEIGEDDDE